MGKHTINPIGKKRFPLTIALLIVLILAACGQNATTSHKPSPGPLTPEPGTNSNSIVPSNGHREYIVAANSTAYVGSDNGTLYALNTGNGTVRWQNKIGSSVFVSTVSNGVVYAYADSSAYAVDAENGSKQWQHPFTREIVRMILTNGVLYIDTTAEQNAPSVYALQAGDGSQIWHYTASAETPGLLGVLNGTVYYMEATGLFHNLNETILALRASNGHLLWRFRTQGTDGLANGMPAEANGILYIATLHGAIYSLRANTGALLWHISRPTGQDIPPVPVSPTVVNGILYVAAQQSIYALRASDGGRVWQYNGSGIPNPSMIQAVIGNGTIYATYGGNSIVALRAKDGSLLWQRTASTEDPPILENGLLQLNLSEGIAALRASDGTQVWKYPLKNHEEGTSNTIPPEIVANGIAYIGTEDGTVHAIQAGDGKQLWHYTIQENPVPLSSPIYSAAITFKSATSYQQALRLVTDLGLQTWTACIPDWKPEGDKDSYQYHNLLVSSTPDGAPEWFDRLKASPEVDSIQPNPVFNCPLLRPTNSPQFLASDKTGTYVQVTFSNTVQSYDTALSAVNDLGFRLASPCYEQKHSQGNNSTWNTAGQEDNFAKTRTLLLATTQLNSTQWSGQMSATAGVIKVEAPFHLQCP